MIELATRKAMVEDSLLGLSLLDDELFSAVLFSKMLISKILSSRPFKRFTVKKIVKHI